MTSVGSIAFAHVRLHAMLRKRARSSEDEEANKSSRALEKMLRTVLVQQGRGGGGEREVRNTLGRKEVGIRRLEGGMRREEMRGLNEEGGDLKEEEERPAFAKAVLFAQELVQPKKRLLDHNTLRQSRAFHSVRRGRQHRGADFTLCFHSEELSDLRRQHPKDATKKVEITSRMISLGVSWADLPKESPALAGKVTGVASIVPTSAGYETQWDLPKITPRRGW
eukprot:729261-Rhodomonas_salina.3